MKQALKVYFILFCFILYTIPSCFDHAFIFEGWCKIEWKKGSEFVVDI